MRLERLEGREVPATVTATDDVDDYDPTDPGDWAGPNGELSLREAIRQVNAEFGGTIDFAVDTVTLTQPLAPVTPNVTVMGQFAGGAPGTVIDGAGVSGGITLTVGGTVRDVVVQGFGGPYGMSIGGTADVQNCYFGTSADGLAAAGNAGAGLVIKGGTVRNSVFSGNGGAGLQVTGTAVIENNRFGTDAGGNGPLSNGSDGLVLTGPASVVRNNVLAGNAAAGLRITGSAAVGNKVTGNKVGVGADGTTAVANTVGIVITGAARGTIVGGTAAADRNAIAGNTETGVFVERAGTGTKVLGNWIGVAGPVGTLVRPNGGNGVFVRSTTGTVVGGTAAGSRNVIAGNTGAGVRLEGVAGVAPATRANRVEGNWIGLDATEAAAGNAGGGVVIAGGAAANTIGGTLLAARNVISGNGAAGVTLTGAGTTSNLVQGNYIGTNAAGTEARPNGLGVEIAAGALTNTVGGGLVGARNLIAGNSEAGVFIHDPTTRANRVLGNFIGTQFDGTAALGNGEDGVRIDGAIRTVIGGATVGARNIISGNGGDGVAIDGVSGQDQQNVIIGNYIGLDVAGATALGNQRAGVSVAGGRNNRVGGVTVGERNTIAGQSVGYGVHVHTGATNTWVVGNHIGTDAKGKAPVANQVGVLVGPGTTTTTVGGAVRGQGNVIAGNAGDGVRLEAATNVRNNLIGTDRTATLNLGNFGNGVSIDGDRSVVGGGSTLANVIAHNQSNGVVTVSGSGNTVTSNRIFDNGGLGINVMGGANDGMSPPQITGLLSGGVIIMAGQLFGRPNTAVRMELYGNPQSDPSGMGEGALFMAAVNGVKTDANGAFTVTFRRSVLAAYPFLCLTATDANGNTSGFSFVVMG